jgi:hypothetical protein
MIAFFLAQHADNIKVRRKNEAILNFKVFFILAKVIKKNK